MKIIPAEQRITAVKEELESLAENRYADFSSGLIPETGNLLGVRLPHLRRIAKREAKNGWREFVHAADDSSFEMIMLEGMVIGYAKDSPETVIAELNRFLPKIRNWSHCDSTVATLSIAKKYPDPFLAYALQCLNSDREFTVRFGVAMLSMHFITDEHYKTVLTALNRPTFPGYYAEMAVAWAVSVLYVKYPESTEIWMKNCVLNPEILNKAIRKIRESYRVDRAAKERLTALKR